MLGNRIICAIRKGRHRKKKYSPSSESKSFNAKRKLKKFSFFVGEQSRKIGRGFFASNNNNEKKKNTIIIVSSRYDAMEFRSGR